MRKLDIYTFDELPEEYQDYVIANFDTKHSLRTVLDLVSQWADNAAEALWGVDIDMAKDFADEKDIPIDEDYLDDFDALDYKSEIKWSKLIDEVWFMPADCEIKISCINEKADCKIVRSISDGEFRKLSVGVRREIETYEDNVKKFATMLLDAQHNCKYYELPEDDLRYALKDAGLEYIVKDSGEVLVL